MKRIAVIALACSLAMPVLAKDIATVDGQGISQDKYDRFISLLIEQGAQDSPEMRGQVKQEMINRLVIVQAAEKLGLDKDPSVQLETELASQSILVRALMARHLKENPISDADIQKEYESIKAQQAERKEYKVRHILLDEEDQAKSLLESIKSGKTDFADAARKDSKDPGSGHSGGELGWAPSSNYVPEFAQAVESLKKGELSSAPVKTKYGWHIIELEDERPMAFPSLEEARPQMEEMMRQQSLSEYQQSLMKQAKIVENP